MRLTLNIILAFLIGITYVCAISAISLTYSNYNENQGIIQMFAICTVISGIIGMGVLYLKDYLGYDQEGVSDD